MKQDANILFVLNGRSRPDALLGIAARLAQTTGARLTAAEVVEDGDQIVELIRFDRRAALERAIEPLRAAGLAVAVRQLHGPAPDAIAEAAERYGFDLVVKTPDAANDPQLLRRCPAPVWIVKSAAAPPSRLLAAVDPFAEGEDAELNREVLATAVSAAQALGARLEVVSAWAPVGPGALASAGRLAALESEARKGQRSAVAELPGAPADDGRLHLIGGSPAEVIPAVAQREGAELIVAGTRARAGVAGLLVGNTAERLLKRSDCSLLVVPSSARVAELEASAA